VSEISEELDSLDDVISGSLPDRWTKLLEYQKSEEHVFYLERTGHSWK